MSEETLSSKIVDACSIDSFTVIEADDVKEAVRKFVNILKSDKREAEEPFLTENAKNIFGEDLI